MLWAVGGNLKCESTPQGVRAEVSGLRYVDTLLFGLVLIFAAPSTVFDGRQPGSSHAISVQEVVGASLMACAGLAVLIYAARSGSTIVTLDREELKIVRRRFGIDWRTRAFPTSAVRNLSYMPPKGAPFLSRGRGLPGEICFDVGRRTYRICRGIDYDDAKELIRQMTKIFRFPWDLPDEQEAGLNKKSRRKYSEN